MNTVLCGWIVAYCPEVIELQLGPIERTKSGKYTRTLKIISKDGALEIGLYGLYPNDLEVLEAKKEGAK